MKRFNSIKISLSILIYCYTLHVYAVAQIPKVVVGNKPTVSTWVSSSITSLPILTVTQQQIKIMGAENVQQILAFSGLQIHDLGEGGTQTSISMRGFGDNASANMLILLNGHPMTTPDMSSFDVNQIPVNSIKRIDIYSGSEGVRYGNQAVGGVINIITLPIGKPQQTLGFGLGSYNTKKIQGNFSGQLSAKTKAQFNFFHRDSDNYRQHNHLNHTHLNLGIEKKLDSGDLNIDYQFDHQRVQYPGALTQDQLNNPQQTKNNSDFEQKNTHNLQLGYRYHLNQNWQLKLDGLFNVMTGAGIISLGKTPYDFNKKRYEIDLHPAIEGLFNFGDETILSTSGIEFNRSDYYFNNVFGNSTARQNIYSAFTQFNIPLPHTWTLFIGGRYAQGLTYSHSDSSNSTLRNHDHLWVTNIGLSWQIKPDLRFYLRRAGNYRFPKTDEQFDYQGNASPLKVQTGVSYETGISWIKTNWSGLLSLYRLNLHNEIATIPVPNRPDGVENTNLPPTQRDGIALHFNYRPWKKLTLGFIYHYVDGKFSSGPYKGNRIPFVPRNHYIIAAIYQIEPHWSVMLQSDYTGDRTDANDPNEASPNKVVSGYTIYNANIRYHYHRITINLRLNNILDKQYYAYVVYNPYATNPADQVGYYPAPGRNIMLNCNIAI